MMVYDILISTSESLKLTGGLMLLPIIMMGGGILDSRGHSIRGDEDCCEEEIIFFSIMEDFGGSESGVLPSFSLMVGPICLLLGEVNFGCFMAPGFCLCTHSSIVFGFSITIVITYMISGWFQQPTLWSVRLTCPGGPAPLCFMMFFFELMGLLVRFVSMTFRLSVNLMIGHLLVSGCFEVFTSVWANFLFILDFFISIKNCYYFPDEYMGVKFSFVRLFDWFLLFLVCGAIFSGEAAYASFHTLLYRFLFGLYVGEHGRICPGNKGSSYKVVSYFRRGFGRGYFSSLGKFC